MSPKLAKKEIRLTEVELELMNLLWKLGEGSVNDVLELLPANRKLAYTSVSTILRILEQKKILTSRKEGRGHVYRPLVSKEEYEKSALNQIVENVFDGAPSALVRRLLDESQLSDEELEKIREILDGKSNS